MMDAPRIQYAQTSDGVSIAFWSLGEGVPLVLLPHVLASHIQMEWNVRSRRDAFEHLASRAKVVRYDYRGVGMSERDAVDFSLEAASRDLEAVVDRLGLDRFAVLSQDTTGRVGFHYAATYPERVSHLNHRVRQLQVSEQARRRATIAPLLASQDWELFTEVLARVLAGWNNPGASPLAALIRASHSAESYAQANDAMTVRVPDEVLSRIRAPTLLLHELGVDEEADSARSLASRITDAHLLGLPEPTGGPYSSELGQKAILDFITATPSRGDGRTAAPVVDVSALRTVLFTDIVEHTELMQRIGDEACRALLREHERLTREVLKGHAGVEVKTIGDSFMASFPSVTKAVECAIALQRAFAAWNETAQQALHVRVGLDAGEPIAEEDDLFGTTVIMASRITNAAEGGEILVSDVVRQLSAGKGFLFSERDAVALKGFEEPQRLFAVRWREEA